MKNIYLHDYLENATYDTTRDGFGLGLKEAAEENSQVVGLCADLTESTRMHWFAKSFPERFIQVGVAEENMAGLAAGLSLAGKIPFLASYAAFSPGNSWGVIRSSICYSNLNVKIVGGHAGLGIGPDGATHQALEDLALMQVLPNMSVVVPCDKEEARKATIALAKTSGPAYLRTTKYENLTITTSKTPFELGKALVLRDGADVALVACGPMVGKALLAAELLSKQKVSALVLNMHTIKPLDVAAIHTLTNTVSAILTIEDHQVFGGLGSGVAGILAQLPEHPPLRMMGMQDSFGESGSGDELYKKYHLTPQDIAKTAREILE